MSFARRAPHACALVLLALASNAACNAILGQKDADGAPGPDAGAPDAVTDAGSDAADAPDAVTEAGDASSPPTTLPALHSFEIAPLYYGDWPALSVDRVQSYLVGLTQYLTGANAKFHDTPVPAGYGITSASVLPPILKPADASAPPLDEIGARNAIRDAQAAGLVPAYAPDRLILLLTPTSASLTPRCAYHGAATASSFYAVASDDCEPASQAIAREVLEAAVDPAGGLKPYGAGNAPCDTRIQLWFGAVPGIYDKGRSACTTTGYNTATTAVAAPGRFSAYWLSGNVPQIQMDGAPFTTFAPRADELANRGWRLQSLQPYIASDTVLYNAVWRPGTNGEKALHALSADTLKAQNDAFAAQGYRFKMLEPYVTSLGQVLYSAVWETSAETQSLLLDRASDDFNAQYAKLYAQGYRIKTLRAYAIGNVTYYSAVCRASTDPETVVLATTGDAFKAKYDTLWDAGWRLRVLQPYVVNGQVFYTIVWRMATPSTLESYNWDNADDILRNKDDYMLDVPYRLESLMGVAP